MVFVKKREVVDENYMFLSKWNEEFCFGVC